MTNKIQSICARCASGEKGSCNCCVEPFLDGSTGFGLTISDVARIMKHTGLSPDKFCVMNWLDKEDYKAEPESYFTPLILGDRWLGMKGDKKCFFLSDKGCTIFEARPRICRIHPFWFDWDEANNDRIQIMFEHHELDRSLCAWEHKGQPHAKMLESLHDTEENLGRNIRQFLEEIELHRKWKDVLLKKGVKAALKESGIMSDGGKAKKIY